MSNETLLDLDALLDTNLDNVETVPDYVTPGKSILALKIKSAEIKKGKNKEQKDVTNIIITYEIADTIESDEPPFPNGSLFSERFAATEDGLKYFKKQALKILNVADAGGATLREIMDGLAGVEFKAAITQRVSESNGKSYTHINVRPLHDEPAA